MDNNKINSVKEFAKYFSDTGLWKKMKSLSIETSRELIENALLLYFSLKEPTTPKISKAIILGALGYFIFPFDVVPDFIPLIGFTDDIGVLISALVAINNSLPEEIKTKAKDQTNKWISSKNS
ncbi:MAG: YkvA family protein [Bacteriovoracaceae bacterium]|nr:YkvA family protein [Bacteriovoracaceae bacterium]